MDFELHEMVAIPAGEVRLHDARRKTVRNVHLEAFSLSSSVLVPVGENRPAPSITWSQAIRLCNEFSAMHGLQNAYEINSHSVAWNVTSNGFRLPTEAEWEYACRAGTGGAHYGDLGDVAWTRLDGVDEAQPVKSKIANAFGLYDTLGNVWEWCWDYLDPARYGAYRVFRGGGWADPPWSVRASVRRGSAPDAVVEGTGLRIAQGAAFVDKCGSTQGWSAVADRERADVRGPLPLSWTPLRELLIDSSSL